MANNRYPATPLIAEDAVYDVEGVRLDTKLGSLSTEITEIDGRVTALENGGGGGGTSTPSGDPMHYMYVLAGATWNASTNYWEMNGLTDITTEQMRTIYYETNSSSAPTLRAEFYKTTARTNIKFNVGFILIPANSLNFQWLFRESTSLEVVTFEHNKAGMNGYWCPNTINGVFFSNIVLKKVLGTINLTSCTNVGEAFKRCYLLEDVSLTNLKLSISFSDSPNLTAASVAYIINNAANTSAITITLHADAYARAIADADIVSAAASHNITLASA